MDLADLAAARDRVAEHVPPTPARRWPLLERSTGTETWVKHENHNPTGAFKVRGGRQPRAPGWSRPASRAG